MQTGIELFGVTLTGDFPRTAYDYDDHRQPLTVAPPPPSASVSRCSTCTTARQLVVNIAAGLLKAMAKVVRNNPEILCLLFVAGLSVVLSKVSQNSGVVQSPSVPSRIFVRDSPVFEFNDGNIQSAMLQIQKEENEFSFVMYYAHWDGNSRDAAIEFDKAARRLSHQVTFVAVNCWWMHGSCKHRIKTTMFPALLATAPTIRNGIQYTGILQAEEMVVFLQRLCQPLTYVTDMHGLYRLHAQRGTVVVGYFDWTGFPLPPGLASFQKAAWLALEKDVIDPVAFAVVTNSKLGRRLGLDQSQSISIVRALNSTLIYPKEANFRAKLIMEWTYKHRESIIEWLAPAGVKSTIMASQIDRTPAVILFTSHDHQRGLLNDYYLFKEIALDYFNCYNSSLVQKMTEEIHSARKKGCEQDTTSPHCDDGNHAAGKTPVTCDCCQTLVGGPVSVATSHGRNVCQVCEQSSRSRPTPCSPSLHHNQAALLNFIFRGKAVLAPNSCLHMNYYYDPFHQLQLCCKQCDGIAESACSQGDQADFAEYGDVTSHDTLCQRVLSRTGCHTECNEIFQSQYGKRKWSRTSATEAGRQFRLSQRLDQQESVVNAHLGPFTGLGCRTNRSVKFFAMRSEYFWKFAEQLGISVSGLDSFGGKMAVVLLDNEAEQQHFLSEDVTVTSIMHFIFNYTSSNLTRHLRSSSPDVPTSAYSATSRVSVQEVVSSTFEEIVLDDTKDVLLLYYAPWCGFCARMNHLYLMLAKVFHNSSDLLIARINGDANDLPWHLTPSSYPTLLLFPAGHKEQSLQFPASETLNLPNMIHFVLQHCTLRH